MSDRRWRVLVTDEVDAEGVAELRACAEIEVAEHPTRPWTAWLDVIDRYDAAIGRSATPWPAALLERATRLRALGRAGVGLDNIDVDAATRRGIAVLNAPGSNAVSVAELAFGLLLALVRRLPEAIASMRAGHWDRSRLGGTELRGRTMGIVGLGRIGSEMARRAHAFGMPVVAYDPYVADARFAELGVERVPSLAALLERADVVTLHVPLTAETRGMIGAAELARMRPSAVLLNLARGEVVDEAALLDALKRGRLAGAALDVFAQEPLPPDHPLRRAPNVVLTPHLGASTAEAQRRVAVEVCRAVRDVLLHGDLSRAVNAAGLDGGAWRALRPLLELAERLGRLGAALVGGGLSTVELRYTGSREGVGRPLLAASLQGALEGVVATPINLINALAVAEERGIEVAWGQGSSRAEGGEELELRLEAGERALRLVGALFGGSLGRVVRIGGFRVDIAPRGTLLVLRNRDVPGVIGRVGTLLGQAGVNIAEYHQARLQAGGEALAAVSVDTPVPAPVLAALRALPEVEDVVQVVMDE